MKITITQFIRAIVGTILEDKNGSLKSWYPWFVILCILFGLPFKAKYHKFVQEVTGRNPKLLPQKGFKTALFLTGRRSGKSIITAIIAAYISLFSGKEKLCKQGETPLCPVIAPTIKQARVVKNYLRAIFDLPVLRNQIVRETQWGFELKNKVTIEILTGDWRAVRGYTLIACVIDEICFFGLDAESKVRSDTELIRAVRPSLATLDGWLICISSPYAKKGWAFKTHQKHFGNDSGNVLVVNCPSRTLNPTLPQRIVDEAMQEDMASAKSEYGGEFRDDVIICFPREMIEMCVVNGRKELLPRKELSYFAFADVSGGRSDDASLGIAHKEGSKVIIDCLKRYRPPHSPYEVIRLMSEEIARYNLKRAYGDAYAAEFVTQAFKSNGIAYIKSELPKSGLYLELLPRICSAGVELLDDEICINQLASLERKTRSGGRDIVDHPKGGHDDLANVVAGVCVSATKPTFKIAAGWKTVGT